MSSRYECTCISKYSLVNGECVLGDCSTNPSQCHVNGHCVTTSEGGYKCACIDGYHGDGIQQCVADNMGCNALNCGRNAMCAYNQSTASYNCVCNTVSRISFEKGAERNVKFISFFLQKGFFGNGYDCRPQISCRHNPSMCSADAACVAQPAGSNTFACVCNRGFTGDGLQCNPIPKHESNLLLVNQGMATMKIPLNQSPRNQGTPIYLEPSQMAIALDVDCPRGFAYSSDITGN